MNYHFLSLLFIMLVGCSPLGYLQSPRVDRGVAIGPQVSAETTQPLMNVEAVYEDKAWIVKNSDGSFDTSANRARNALDSVTILDTARNSNTFSELPGLFFVYPRISIAERVRIAGGASVVPVAGLPWALSFETMINIIDIGDPLFFRNIAVGVMGNLFVNSVGTEWEPINKHTLYTGGILVGTYQEMRVGEIELCFGMGMSRHLYESSIGNSEHDVPIMYFTDLFYTFDVAPSVHFFLTDKRHFQFSLGATMAIPVYSDYWIYGVSPRYQSVNVTTNDHNWFKAQAALSWRFGGGKKEYKSDEAAGD